MKLLHKLRVIRNARWFRVCTRGGAIIFLALMCAMWVRSYWRGDGLVWRSARPWLGVGSELGDLVVCRSPQSLASDPAFEDDLKYVSFDPRHFGGRNFDPTFDAIAFRYAQEKNWPYIQYVFMPYWFAITCWLGMIWLIFRFTRPVQMAGTCNNCGYNLRGNPGAACPECGAQPNPVATAILQESHVDCESGDRT